MTGKVIPTFSCLSSGQLVGQLLPRWPDSWKLQSKAGQNGSCHGAGQRGSCHGYHCGTHRGKGTDRRREGQPQGLPHFVALALSRMFAMHSREKRAGCVRAAAALVTAPESHSSSSLSEVCFWGSVQSLCSALVTAREALCYCCFRVHCPCPRPGPWSSTFYQCSGPWCFRKAFVPKDNKSCSNQGKPESYLVAVWVWEKPSSVRNFRNQQHAPCLRAGT